MKLFTVGIVLIVILAIFVMIYYLDKCKIQEGIDPPQIMSTVNQAVVNISPCPPGTYTHPGIVTSTCIPCPIGHECPGNGVINVCTGNEYSDVPGANDCILCPGELTGKTAPTQYLSNDISGNIMCGCQEGQTLIINDNNDWVCVDPANACEANYSYWNGIECACLNGYYKNSSNACVPISKDFMLAPVGYTCDDMNNVGSITNQTDCSNALSWASTVYGWDICYNMPNAAKGGNVKPPPCGIRTLGKGLDESGRNTEQTIYYSSGWNETTGSTEDVGNGYQNLCINTNGTNIPDETKYAHGNITCQYGYMLSQDVSGKSEVDIRKMDISCVKCGIHPGTNSDCTFCKTKEGEAEGWWANASENPDKTKNCYTCPSGTYATGSSGGWKCIQCGEYKDSSVDCSNANPLLYPLLANQANLPILSVNPYVNNDKLSWVGLETNLRTDYNTTNISLPKPSICTSTRGSNKCTMCDNGKRQPLRMMNIYHPSTCVWNPGIAPDNDLEGKGDISLCPLGSWSNPSISNWTEPDGNTISNNNTSCIPYPENYHVKNKDIYANVVIPSTGSFVFSEWSMCDDHLGEHCDVPGLYVPQIRPAQNATVNAGSICNNPTNNPCFQEQKPPGNTDPSLNFYCEEGKWVPNVDVNNNPNVKNGKCEKGFHYYKRNKEDSKDYIAECLNACLSNKSKCGYVAWNSDTCYVLPKPVLNNDLKKAFNTHVNQYNLETGAWFHDHSLTTQKKSVKDIVDSIGSKQTGLSWCASEENLTPGAADISFISMSSSATVEPISFDISWGVWSQGDQVLPNIARCSCRNESAVLNYSGNTKNDIIPVPWKHNHIANWYRKYSTKDDNSGWSTLYIEDISNQALHDFKTAGSNDKQIFNNPVCNLALPDDGLEFQSIDKK